MTDRQFRSWLRIRSEGFTNRIGLVTKSGRPRLSPAKLVENLAYLLVEAQERKKTVNTISPTPRSRRRVRAV